MKSYFKMIDGIFTNTNKHLQHYPNLTLLWLMDAGSRQMNDELHIQT